MIPIKCFTCGNVLADKYRYFKNEVSSQKKESDIDDTYKNVEKINKTVEGQVLDDLKITNICCRRHMLTHVDIN
tara:strand:+ start:1065 stop:1286 length:222 start_codon:yes stop_codon:yes gene_type:complete